MSLIVSILFLVLGYSFPQLYKNQLGKKDFTWLKRLWGYHLIFGLYFYFFVQGDAVGYWAISKQMSVDDLWTLFVQSKGTEFMHVFNYFPSHVLDLSYFAGTMIYCAIGYAGIVYFYIIAKKIIPFNGTFKGYKLFPLLYFSPNLHFWSCEIGKDTLIFFCIGLFIYGFLDLAKRIPHILISLILTYAIRPHITLFLLIAFSGAYILTSKIALSKRILLSLVSLAVVLAILPSVLAFTKIEEASVESFQQFGAVKAGALSRGTTGSAIDVTNYPYPLKVFTFLYRPLFIDGYSVPAILASFENLLFLLLTIQVFKKRPIDTFKETPLVLKGLLLFLGVGTLAFAESLGNLGIMIRMRNMFLPGMLMYFMWVFSFEIQRKKARLLQKRKKPAQPQQIIELK